MNISKTGKKRQKSSEATGQRSRATEEGRWRGVVSLLDETKQAAATHAARQSRPRELADQRRKKRKREPERTTRERERENRGKSKVLRREG